LPHEFVIKLTETAPVSTVTQHWSLETCQLMKVIYTIQWKVRYTK